MADEFGSLAAFGLHMIEREVATVVALGAGLEIIAQKIEETAKDEIGMYQPEVGPFQEWAPLADSTEDEKARLGYPADAPLLRTGEMRDSIEHQVKGLEAVIGSPSDKLYYQEFGTDKIPPRPVIGPAAYRNQQTIQRVVGAAAVSGLTDGSPIHSALGYDLTVK